MKPRGFSANAGFTLVELMIVVAIMGILAAVVAPNWTAFQVRARQGEAKAALASMYASEKAFMLEHSSYTICIRETGYTEESVVRYYFKGANNPDGTEGSSCGPTGTSDCYSYDFIHAGMTCRATCGGVATWWIGTAPIGNDCTFWSNTSANAKNVPAIVSGSPVPANPTWEAHQYTFLFGAVGGISPSAKANGYDVWTINEQKQMINVTSGL
jgi:prepilin-type N-terminal cleavage/methylation domain-containing protein